MNDQEFRTLVENLTPFLFKILTPWSFSKETVEDIVQEVWYKVYRYIDRFKGNSNISTWIYRIAVNTASTWKRKVKFDNLQEDNLQDKNPQTDPSLRVEIDELRKNITNALDKLKSSEREIVVLRVWGEMPFDKIAEQLNSTENSIRVRYFRAIEKLKKSLSFFMRNNYAR